MLKLLRPLFIRLLKLLSRIPAFKIPLPVPGLGCGVVGLVFAHQEIRLGSVAATLLKSLEYRGYDSTGAVIQDANGGITLRKDVGAPSQLVTSLGIEELSGRIFCGQVRWATFGAVNQVNSQPHVVKCREKIYGAHNGNITNTQELKTFLQQEGHRIASDNDGEMLVHLVEHYFHLNLEDHPASLQGNPEIRRKAMRRAVIEAQQQAQGSYAAVIVDPVSGFLWAIKAGSSLYAGVGELDGNAFTLVSSDLTSVLRYTHNLVTLNEHQFLEADFREQQLFALTDYTVNGKNGDADRHFKAGQPLETVVHRSKLRIEDTELKPPFHFYMHQEIYAAVDNAYGLLNFFLGGTDLNQQLTRLIRKENALENFQQIARKLSNEGDPQIQEKIFTGLLGDQHLQKVVSEVMQTLPDLEDRIFRPEFTQREFNSNHASALLLLSEELEGKLGRFTVRLVAKLLDAAAEQREISKFRDYEKRLVNLMLEAWRGRHNIYTIACGTSYHASKTAALFFNEIAQLEIIPILPGNFRGQYSHSLRNHDLMIGISQSGETKDLIDIFNCVEAQHLEINKVVVVNNENSTLAQEKADFYLPIKCGPEVAVPATKSYINQVLLFYYLAIMVAKAKGEWLQSHNRTREGAEFLEAALKRLTNLNSIPDLLEETLRTTEEPVDAMAEALFLEPSIHILATRISSVAEEGALKIRETVLNHTQGIEGAEFKHGPNTILGLNTVLGLPDVEQMLLAHGEMFGYLLKRAQELKLPQEDVQRLISDLSSYLTRPVEPFNLSGSGERLFQEVLEKFSPHNFLNKRYPLIYLTGPEEKDVNLTISQINTHKIRGASTFVIAEDNQALKRNAQKAPEGHDDYQWAYVALPRTDDTLLTTFSSMVVLQLLALKMSVKKMKYLNRLNIPLHGVHPDVPKNVSKSITVD